MLVNVGFGGNDALPVPDHLARVLTHHWRAQAGTAGAILITRPEYLHSVAVAGEADYTPEMTSFHEDVLADDDSLVVYIAWPD